MPSKHPKPSPKLQFKTSVYLEPGINMILLKKFASRLEAFSTKPLSLAETKSLVKNTTQNLSEFTLATCQRRKHDLRLINQTLTEIMQFFNTAS